MNFQAPFFLLSLGLFLQVNAQWPGPDHEYIPPNSSLERGPCPAINTLANHGFINRNGMNVPAAQLYDALLEVYGLDDTTFVSIGFPLKPDPSTNGTTLMLNLHDLYNAEHDSSLVRKDDYFEPLGQPDEGLLAQFQAAAGDDEILTPAEMADFRVMRITDSCTLNPEFTFTREGNLNGLDVSAFEAVLVFICFGVDPDWQQVNVSEALMFLGENRIPENFVPRLQQGQNSTLITDPTIFSPGSVFESFRLRIVEALAVCDTTANTTTAPATQAPTTNDETLPILSTSGALGVLDGGVVVATAAAMLIAVLCS